MENAENFQKNPLAKHFRQPAIHVKLPSNGQFWPDNALDMPVTGELPVYPLTTKDEIILRTPDALMNGSGVVTIIESCIPSIKNGWVIPSIDVDTLLIAIRIASYGETMEVETKCPHCSEANKHGLNLHNCLASIKCPNYTQLIEFDDLKIKLKPTTYFGNNKVESIDFEQQKMLKALERSDISDDVRAKEIQKSMDRLVEISIDILVNNTDYIETSDSTKVKDLAFIKEFYLNAPSKLVKSIQAKLEKLSVDGGIKSQLVVCSECQTQYEVPVIFNYSSFFGDGS